MTVRSVPGQPHLVSPLTLPPATGRPICVSWPGLQQPLPGRWEGSNPIRRPTGQSSLTLLHWCTVDCGTNTIQGVLDLKHTQTFTNLNLLFIAPQG